MRAALQAGAAQRILVVDWDLRHGQGLQQIFEEDPQVLYISLHRYDNGLFPPHSGAAKDVGKGAGKHFTVNVGWRGERADPAMGDSDYFAAFRTVVLPIATEFAPDLIVIAAGFDACDALADRQRIGGYRVSALGYAHMTQMLMGVANGKVVLALEGGCVVLGGGGADGLILSSSHSPLIPLKSSDPKAQALCIEGCLRALLGDELPLVPSHDRPPHPDAVATLLEVGDVHKAHWTSLAAYQAFAAFSPAEFADHDKKQRDEELAATAALASLSMVRNGSLTRTALR